MRKNFQISIYPMTAKKDMKKAKEVVKALKTGINGNASALKCMELETYDVQRVTTYCKKNGELQRLERPCNLKRVTPLQIEIQVYDGRVTLEVSWDVKGIIDDKACYAEIHALASWKDDWYMWYACNEDGTPKAPLATVYINEENI